VTGSVADWCCAHLVFDEAGCHRPFDVAGAEYVRDVLEDFSRAGVTDEVLVWGSQSRKTGTLMGGLAWVVVNAPCAALWVMPNLSLGRRFSRLRLSKLLRRSKATAWLVPAGRDRFKFSTMEMSLGPATVTLVGSNSAANLASAPCRLVLADECDKFAASVRAEASALSLAEQRTKGVLFPQRWKTSTPTVPEGAIWTEYLKGDQRRYFVPCPGCGAELLLAWEQGFTTLRLTGAEAFVAWAPEAKRRDGTWDLAEVAATAHVLCPKCGRKIRDHEKPGMVARGVWRPTATAAAPGFVSRHLSSLYATGPETSWGRLAVRFLQAKDSVAGLRGFINGDLAEPYVSQDVRRERALVIRARAEAGDTWLPLLTVDVQAGSPRFWYVVRRWEWGAGNSQAVGAGTAESWADLDAIRREHGVVHAGVFVDSGYGAASDLHVYAACFEHGDSEGPAYTHWTPCKGRPGRTLIWDARARARRPCATDADHPIDPYEGSAARGRCKMELLTFLPDVFKDWLDRLRSGATRITWAVTDDVASETYAQHMASEVPTVDRNRLTGMRRSTWAPRSRHWPNHLWDCEVLQLVGAYWLGGLPLDGADGKPD
jgi:phage terminase large subunit GpA-like protein